MMRCRKVHRDESGYATILALGAVLVLVAIFGMCLLLAERVIDAHRAQVAADMAATSGAFALIKGDGCEVAAEIASWHQATLDSCEVHGEDLLVTTQFDDTVARARAGPV